MGRTLIAFIAILLVGFGSNTASSQTKRDTLNILFVCNSYTYFENLPHIVSIISNGAKTQLITGKITDVIAYPKI